MSAVARTTSTAESTAEQAQFLTFMLGNEVFAIGILAIKEIIEYDELTTVPMMPDCIRGVINLRGAVVPVMDLARRFSRPAQDVTKRTCIVIIERTNEGEREDIGVVVDAVNAVVDIRSEDIEPPPAFGTRVRPEFIQGLGKVNGRFVILLDVERVLSLDEASALSEAMGGLRELPA